MLDILKMKLRCTVGAEFHTVVCHLLVKLMCHQTKFKFNHIYRSTTYSAVVDHDVFPCMYILLHLIKSNDGPVICV